MAKLTLADYDSIVLALRITAPISFMCSVVLITLFWRTKSLQTIQNRLIYNTEWSNLIYTAMWFIARWGPLAGDTSPLCQIQGVLILYFAMTDTFWITFLAVNVYLVVVRKWTDLEKKILYYHLLAWIVPFIVFIPVPFIKNDKLGPIIGSRYMWCSMRAAWGDLLLETLYVPTWIAFVISATAFGIIVKVVVGIRKEIKLMNSGQKRNRKMERFLFCTSLYIIQYFVLWSFPTINRAIQAYDPTFQDYFLTAMNGLCGTFRGISHLIVFTIGNLSIIGPMFLPPTVLDYLGVVPHESHASSKSGPSQQTDVATSTSKTIAREKQPKEEKTAEAISPV
ncbi:hypothetical protein BJ742DRAFT_899535 [Cladochytrium replicatum]|nr:hypothetical protein BJ742DRAFT_899535 [Cladochytrium replicatum]